MSSKALLSLKVMYHTICHRAGREPLGGERIGAAVDEIIRLMECAVR